MKRMSPKFIDLDLSQLNNKIVILDVDGTLVPDGGYEVDQATFAKVQEIAGSNSLFLCSNKADGKRNDAIQDTLAIRSVSGVYRKPDPRIKKLVLDQVEKSLRDRKIVVIGDKSLVDGRFARKIGATFIKVERIHGTPDRLHTRLAYLLDNLYSYITRT